MKKLFVLLLSLFCILLSSCSLTPADYAEDVINKVSKIEKQTGSITESLKNRNIEDAVAKLSVCQSEAEKTLAELKELGPYDQKSVLNEDNDFIEAAIDFVEFYDNIYKNEYKQCFDILLKGSNNYTKEDIEKISVILSSVENESKFVKKELIRNFKIFCKNYDLTISGY